MWRCPNCGEGIDDVFDACWKCGTAQDGTSASNPPGEPQEPEAAAPTSQPPSLAGADEDSRSLSGDAKHGRIVELCAARNSAEAYSYCSWLEEAGIRCRVVGEFLGGAAGSLPLGYTIAPRIWVREEDAARARDIIDGWISRSDQEASISSAEDEGVDIDTVSKESPTSARGTGHPWLGSGLALLGLTCVLAGAIWAGLNWTTMRACSAVAEGVFERYRPHFSMYSPPPPQRPMFSMWCDAEYAFMVKGRVYYSYCGSEGLVRYVLIHYDPRDPTANFVRSPILPWQILISAMGIGGSLLIVGAWLRSPWGRKTG